ncbi:hypothetical protein [Actinoplanes sp. NPDC049802]|uniref:hypothetical protein n=1 Tax=Actinoplanes sp. NPDC049802 TaxID=3154742 RepID=UPI0033ED6FD6
MSAWWPWSAGSEDAPVPADPSLDLATVLTEHNERWRDRALKADRLLIDAFHRYGRWVPVDVVLDAHNILQPPPPLRPAVPVIPGSEG